MWKFQDLDNDQTSNAEELNDDEQLSNENEKVYQDELLNTEILKY